MTIRLILMAAWLAFVAACSEQIGAPQETETPVTPLDAQREAEPPAPVFVQIERSGPETSTSAIDWVAAREDMAANAADQPGGGFQVQSGNDAPPVPVLLPTGLVTIQSSPGEAPRFRSLPDGYFARYPGLDYNVTVSGTNEVFAGTTEAPTDQQIDPVFRRTGTGAIVTITRYGAGYMIEFECKGAEGALGDGCVGEDEALEVANGLVVMGTR